MALSARMQLNGWQRLWVVISICWLFFSGILTYDTFSSLYAKKTYVVEKAGVGKAELVFSGAQTDNEIREQLANEFIPLMDKTPKAYVNRVVATPYERYVAAHAATEGWRSAEIALIPVLGLFFVGWTVAWVRRGFKSDAKT